MIRELAAADRLVHCPERKDREDDGFGEVFPKQHKFGEVLAEFDQAKAWVHSVAWSPAGFRIAFAGALQAPAHTHT